MMTSSATNRSFRLPRRVLSNRQNQSFPSWSNLDESHGGNSKGRTTLPPFGSSTSQNVLPSPSKCSRQNTCSSSFWVEWADEMLMNEENEGFAPHQISLFNEDHRHCSSTTTSPKKPLLPPSSDDDIKKKGSKAKSSPMMASQLVMNSSMNSVSVINMSVGPLGASPAAEDSKDGDLDQLHDAMTDNMAAQHLLESEKYQEAMIIYRKAIRQFVKICDNEHRVVAGVNAASCYRNMSTAARLLKQPQEATNCLALAVAWYLKSHALVTQQAQKSIVTLDGKMIDDSFMSPNKSVTSLTDTASIDDMLIEALHAQAKLHLEHEGNIAGAFAAHDSILAHLVELNKLEHWKAASTTLLSVDGVVFTAPTLNQQTAWLVESLKALGDYFMGYKQFSDTPLALFEKGVDIFQNRFEDSDTKCDDLNQDLAIVLRQLSEIYFSRQLHDLAADALHDSASIQLRASGKPSEDALRIMEKVGAANERAQCFDEARSCYEQIMMARSKFYGTTDLSVAKALFDIGRTMEKKAGPTMESEEILKTANSILALHLTEGKPELRENMDLLMQLLPSIQHFDRSSSVVNDLDKSLSELHVRSNTFDEGPFDRAQIYFNLGRGFMRLGKHSLASVCLDQATKEAEACRAEQAEILSKSMQMNESNDTSMSLARGETRLNGTPRTTVSINMEDSANQPKQSAAKSVAFANNEISAFPEPFLYCQESSVLQETDPSMYFFEDAPNETSCYQPTKRDKCCPPTSSKQNKIFQPVSSSLKVEAAEPIKRKYVSATHMKPVTRKNSWRKLLCPVWSVSKPVGLESPVNTSRESLQPIIRSQHETSVAGQVKQRPRLSARSKLVTKLCTIPESRSFGHEKEEPSTRHLLDSSIGSLQSSSGFTRMPQQSISYTTMRRNQYAAV